MPTCNNCKKEFEAEDLVRHEHGKNLVVACPDCKRVLGRYYMR